MEVLLRSLAFCLVCAIPLVPLVAKRLQRASRPAARLIGRVLAFLSLWCTFNMSFAAIWGAVLVRGLEPREVTYFFLWLALSQIPALIVVHRLVRDEPPMPRARGRTDPSGG